MTVLPEGLQDFIAGAGWGEASIEAIPGDASFRRYFRLRNGANTAMLMHAPPPHEDPRPFVFVAEWLLDNDMRAPELLAQDLDAGWLLIEDFLNFMLCGRHVTDFSMASCTLLLATADPASGDS